MIRRDDGGDWLIIEQIKHANLAAEIARVWGNDQFEPLTRLSDPSIGYKRPLDEEYERTLAVLAFSQGVAHHDDGWSEWDWAPRIDSRTGKPRDFREMRMADVTAIWSKSISSPSKYVPLAAYAISRHFCYLAEQVRDGGRHGADDVAAVTQFLHEQAALQRKLDAKFETELARFGWQQAFHLYRELAYRTVQFFDRVSLWLCCADEKESQTMTAPKGEGVTFASRPASPIREETTSGVYRLQTPRPDYRRWRVRIEPYPLCDGSPEFRVDARRIPARRYDDDADLLATWKAAPTAQLVWTFDRT
jgi:hypothetical protein